MDLGLKKQGVSGVDSVISLSHVRKPLKTKILRNAKMIEKYNHCDYLSEEESKYFEKKLRSFMKTMQKKGIGYASITFLPAGYSEKVTEDYASITISDKSNNDLYNCCLWEK